MLIGWRDGLRPSPLFDSGYYREQMSQERIDPLLHFLQRGAAGGLDPHPLFDTNFYISSYLPDAGAINPLYHYETFGGTARLDPSSSFNTAQFLSEFPYADLFRCPLKAFATIRAFQEFEIIPEFDSRLYRYQLEVERNEKLNDAPIVHYLARGYRDETLLPNLCFDPRFYRERNHIFFEGPALLHYLREGDQVGLHCHPFFSSKVYNEQRGSGVAEMSALEHFTKTSGAELITDRRMKRPLDPKVFAFIESLISGTGKAYDNAFYRSANLDLSEVESDQLERHYIDHGQQEGRVASPSSLMRRANARISDISLGFFSDEYQNLNPDLAVYDGDFVGLFCHYMFNGRNETDRMIGMWQFFYDDVMIDLPTTGTPLRVIPSAERINVCILIHAFYPDVWQELAAFARNFRDRSFDIFINLVDLS